MLKCMFLLRVFEVSREITINKSSSKGSLEMLKLKQQKVLFMNLQITRESNVKRSGLPLFISKEGLKQDPNSHYLNVSAIC